MMTLTTSAFAKRLEHAEAIQLQRQVEAFAQISPHEKCYALPIAGGIAAVTLKAFGRKLNHIAGFAMTERPTISNLAEVEDVYAKCGLTPEIDVCPYVDSDVLTLLASRGYVVTAFVNVFAKVLGKAEVEAAGNDDVVVEPVAIDELPDFVSHSVSGFLSGRRPPELLRTLAQIAVRRADTKLYFARVAGKIAGSAGLSLIETPFGGVAHLYIDSTLPEYRGRGVQAALIRARLAAAHRAGYDLASLSARPTNASSRNAGKSGFTLAYTRPTFRLAR
jgi:GNAT superfamily N-acetyltransferase